MTKPMLTLFMDEYVSTEDTEPVAVAIAAACGAVTQKDKVK
jgi:hypothetical protein